VVQKGLLGLRPAVEVRAVQVRRGGGRGLGLRPGRPASRVPPKGPALTRRPWRPAIWLGARPVHVSCLSHCAFLCLLFSIRADLKKVPYARPVKLDEHLVHVAPPPVLSRLEGLDYGVIRGMEVPGRMFVLGRVAASDVPADEALLAALGARGDVVDLPQVRAPRRRPSKHGSLLSTLRARRLALDHDPSGDRARERPAAACSHNFPKRRLISSSNTGSFLHHSSRNSRCRTHPRARTRIQNPV
jgi:hypothetical protein